MKKILYILLLVLPLNLNAQFILNSFISFPPAGGGYDADAQAWFTAAGITDPTAMSAANQLVLDLKSASLWTKIKALYLLTNSTTTKNKFNLKDPQDLDASYRVTWNGTITMDGAGMMFDATTKFGNTHFVPNTSFGNFNSHVSVYSQTNNTIWGYDIGSGSGGTASTRMGTCGEFNTGNGGLVSQSSIAISANNTRGDGFFVGSRTASNSIFMYRSSVSIGNSTATSTATRSTTEMYLGGFNNNGTVFSPSPSRKLSLVSIGDGLTATEAANLYTAVQAWATALGINK